MEKIYLPGSTLLAPVPAALVSCGTVENPNALAIAWTGILNSNPPKTYISVQPIRYSYNIIKESGDFVINLAGKELVKAVDYCGVRSGKDENKLEKCNLTAIQSKNVSSPAILQCPINIECKVCDIIHLGSHDMFIADIVGINVDKNIVDENGKIHYEKANLFAYSHGEYFELGKKIGDFGFSVRKPSTEKRRKEREKKQNAKNSK